MTTKEAEEILLSYASPNGIGFSEVKKAIYVILDEYHRLLEQKPGLIDSKKAAEEFGQLLESGFFETCPLTQEEIDRCLDDLRREEENATD